MSTETVDRLVALGATRQRTESNAKWDVIIKARRGWIPLNLGDLWQYRELLYFLTWRDLKLRYQQTFLGVTWAMIQPLITMLMFAFIFHSVARIPSAVPGVPYAVSTFCGLLPWTFFAYALSQSSNSLVGSANLISKVYFPRLIIPVASTLSGLVDFGIAFVILLFLMKIYNVAPTINVIFLPFFIVLALIAALAVGIWLSALNVEYRDVQYMVPFITQFWMYATPVIVPLYVLAHRAPWAVPIISLNPLTGVVDGSRWALLGANSLDVLSLAISAATAILGLLLGLVYFRRMERKFADVI
jgi:lipopolysaccharide transport system permease protein